MSLGITPRLTQSLSTLDTDSDQTKKSKSDSNTSTKSLPAALEASTSLDDRPVTQASGAFGQFCNFPYIDSASSQESLSSITKSSLTKAAGCGDLSKVGRDESVSQPETKTESSDSGIKKKKRTYSFSDSEINKTGKDSSSAEGGLPKASTDSSSSLSAFTGQPKIQVGLLPLPTSKGAFVTRSVGNLGRSGDKGPMKASTSVLSVGAGGSTGSVSPRATPSPSGQPLDSSAATARPRSASPTRLMGSVKRLQGSFSSLFGKSKSGSEERRKSLGATKEPSFKAAPQSAASMDALTGRKESYETAVIGTPLKKASSSSSGSKGSLSKLWGSFKRTVAGSEAASSEPPWWQDVPSDPQALVEAFWVAQGAKLIAPVVEEGVGYFVEAATNSAVKADVGSNLKECLLQHFACIASSIIEKEVDIIINENKGMNGALLGILISQTLDRVRAAMGLWLGNKVTGMGKSSILASVCNCIARLNLEDMIINHKALKPEQKKEVRSALVRLVNLERDRLVALKVDEMSALEGLVTIDKELLTTQKLEDKVKILVTVTFQELLSVEEVTVL